MLKVSDSWRIKSSKSILNFKCPLDGPSNGHDLKVRNFGFSWSRRGSKVSKFCNCPHSEATRCTRAEITYFCFLPTGRKLQTFRAGIHDEIFLEICASTGKKSAKCRKGKHSSVGTEFLPYLHKIFTKIRKKSRAN